MKKRPNGKPLLWFTTKPKEKQLHKFEDEKIMRAGKGYMWEI